jgi:type IV secretion system protein TrbI
VSRDVRDSVTQTEVLTPAGSIVHGEQREINAANLNDCSLAVVWDDIVLPDGAHIAIPKLPSADAQGYTSLAGEVDRHLAQLWGPALLVSAISAGVMLAQNPTYGGYQGCSATQEASGAITSSLASRAMQPLNSEFGPCARPSPSPSPRRSGSC